MAKLAVTLEDAFKRTTKRVIGMEDQVLLADYAAAVTAWAAAFGDVSDLGIVKTDLIIPVTGLESAAVAASNIDRGGTFSGWLDTVAPKKASLKLPCPKLSLVAADGTIAITGDFNLSDGEQIDSWIKGTLDK
jgi:hypothetical protein